MRWSRTAAGFAVALGVAVAAVPVLTVETVQAQRSEGWYTVLGSFGNRSGAHRRASRECLQYGRHEVYVVDSDDVEGFTPGLWVVVAGPFRGRQRADAVAREFRRCVPDAYVRYGSNYGDWD